ncbi:MAG: primosomal protein N' [Spirochaetaceae bacterium]|jgi:primosomal protein N' (replication factor Y)|nr:primosomal protein N' [Spirochaetaceae bacterium]
MDDNIYYVELVFNLPVKQSFTYSFTDEKPSIGMRAEAQLKNRKLTGLIISVGQQAPHGYKAKALLRLVDKEALFQEDSLDLARWLSDFYLCSLGEALFTMLPGGRVEKEIPAMDLDNSMDRVKNLELTEEQNLALKSISADPQGFWYLQGVTGSGKTEVYLLLAEQVLKQNKSVIYMVPEISLTHQLIDPVKKRFPKRVAVMHSHLTPSQRLKEWRRILSGEADFIIGARSAVFAPVKSLGLIILDEEHESSYKAGSTPRYHGRQVAMYRASQSKALFIMGSATPSLEAWYSIKQGKIQAIQMSQRAAGGKLPTIKLVDMTREEGIFSELLIKEINLTISQGKQVVLFLNRRGFSYHFHCRSCGYELTCHQCSVGLTFHKERSAMICHYCGYQRPVPPKCPSCNSFDVGYSGFGTEQIEHEMERLFPKVSLLRLDRDIASKKGETKRILKAFKEGESQVLLGTQMVAKGLNFPGVKLVGIILADTTLNLPDFRSPERTFNLVTQVAGRAGRYSDDGVVILQTFRPQSPALQMAIKGELEEFFQEEWQTRKLLGFPPAARMIRLVFRSRVEEKAIAEAEKAAGIFKHWGAQDLMGPAECALGKVSGNFRYQLLLRAKELSEIHGLVSHYMKEVELNSAVYIEVDIDPQSLL